MSDFRKSIRKALNRPTPTAPRANLQSLVLTGLNLLQVLEENAPKYLQNWLHYGPSAFLGEGWAANLLWYREKGYNNYQELRLFGVWARKEEDATTLLIGTKPLQFTAPIFNAESYNAIIKTNFKPYYNDSAEPPAEDDIHFRTVYEESRRLALRRELADKIIQSLREKN
jgi:hypothetical protein